MRKKPLLINLLAITAILLFASSCEKDDNAIKSNTVINPDEKTGTLTDIQGNVYKIVKIGEQWWMAENLKYLPSVTGSTSVSETSPYYYVYDYNGTVVANAKATDNYTTHGVLYNWAAAMAGSPSSTDNPSGVQGVCPTGWHLPSNAEWTQLTDYLGGTSAAGVKLKEIGTTHWEGSNIGATNETGFTALPSGYFSNGFACIGTEGYWWSTTESSSSTAHTRLIQYNQDAVLNIGFGKEIGFSVRCVKD